MSASFDRIEQIADLLTDRAPISPCTLLTRREGRALPRREYRADSRGRRGR